MELLVKLLIIAGIAVVSSAVFVWIVDFCMELKRAGKNPHKTEY